MVVFGLTGGIGSGKSTVAELLEFHGAVLIDADRITRALQQPGEPVFEAILERFGDSFVAEGGGLDRQRLADLVFRDEEARRDLEAIVHPEVGRVIGERLAAESETDHLVVLDIPLLAEGAGRNDLAGTVVVDTDPEIAVGRLVDQRGFDEGDARRRLQTQASRDERLARADFVVENDGSLADLERQVERCWQWMLELARHHASR